jgi:hypothetical protein
MRGSPQGLLPVRVLREGQLSISDARVVKPLAMTC